MKLLSPYFTDQKIVGENYSNSEISNLTNCVLQGSILGPLLFHIYFNGLPQKLPGIEC